MPFANISDEALYVSTIEEARSKARSNGALGDLMGSDPISNLHNVHSAFDSDEVLQDKGTQNNPNCKYYYECEFNRQIINVVSECMSYMALNIRSIVNNLDKLEAFLAGLHWEFDIIMISKTWLTNSTHNLYTLPNYHTYNTFRKGKRGGGVSIMLKDTYKG